MSKVFKSSVIAKVGTAANAVIGGGHTCGRGANSRIIIEGIGIVEDYIILWEAGCGGCCGVGWSYKAV